MATSDKLSVFLCHSSTDKPVVKELYKRLSALDWIDPWLDAEKLLPGQDWNLEIEKAVETANVVIVVLSKGSIDKEGYVQRELRFALDIALEKPEGTIFIIPLRLEELELPRRLRAWQYVDYFPRNKRIVAYEKLLESLRIRAAKLGIDQNIESPSSLSITRIQSKKKSSSINIHLQKIITSDAEFPIREIPFSQNRNFSGRKNILELIRTEFTNPNVAVPVYAITGLGGIGKTQIAIRYSYHYAQEYDLVWWIRSETDASLSADYQSLSNALRLPVKTKAEQMVFINIVNNYLENTDRKWLLVFDNVESQEKIEKILPRKGNGHILITSQSRGWHQIASDSHLIPFTEEEGREFLNRRINEKDTEKADKLTKLLGGLPLAMEQACAYISRHGTPIDVYTKLFEEYRQELLTKQTLPKDYHATITTTWKLAFKQIQQIQPVAEELLRIFVFFAPDGVPISIFRSHALSLPETMQKVVNNFVEFEECLAALYSYSLIERDGDLVSIHRLIQDVVRSSLSSEDLQKWLGLVLEIMEKSFPYDEYDLSTWSACSLLMPHALFIISYAEKYDVGLPLVSDLCQNVGKYLQMQGEYKKAEAIVKYAADIRTKVLGQQSEKVAESIELLGEIYRDQAKYDDALALYQKVSSILSHLTSRNNKLRSRNLNNLGKIFHVKGDFQQARKYYEEGLTLSRNAMDESQPETALILNNLGALVSDEGNDDISRAYHEEALKINQMILGDQHPETLRSLAHLGTILSDLGDFETGKRYLEQTLSIRREVLGKNHLDTADSLNRLGRIFYLKRDYQTSLDYQNEALSIHRSILGDNHPDIAVLLCNVGSDLVGHSKYVEARYYLEQALSIYEKALDVNHHHLVIILSHLADVMYHLRLFPRAREYVFRAMKICQEAKENYGECEDVKRLQKLIPMVGKKKKDKKGLK